MSLHDRVLRTLRRHAMAPAGARVLVAVSGGADSVALLHLLVDLGTSAGFGIAGVGHFNHRLRGAEADADERFCRELADRLGLPFRSGSGDVRARAAAVRRSIEDVARQARYAFLEEARAGLGAAVVAVGHTRNDQAETFLLRLLRGAGARGLGGIRPRAGRIVRPLLDVSRVELREYLAARGIDFREDPSNLDCRIPRNRVRHGLIPYLEREFSPGIVDVLAREADIAREDEEHLQREAIELDASLVSREGSFVEIEVAALTSLDAALARRVVLDALTTLADGRFVGFEHVADVLALAREGGEGQSLSLPGQQARRQAGRIVLGPEPDRGRAPGPDVRPAVALPVPGEVTLAPQGWTISAECLDRLEGPPPSGYVAAVAVEPLALPLAVRLRRPGDRLRPLGMGGRARKLQDFLVDRKVARGERDTVPLVTDATDRIVWVVGHAVGEDFRVTEASRGVILLKARRLGGSG